MADISSIGDGLASALLGAWTSGKSGWDAFKNYIIQSILDNVIKNALSSVIQAGLTSLSTGLSGSLGTFASAVNTITGGGLTTVSNAVTSGLSSISSALGLGSGAAAGGGAVTTAVTGGGAGAAIGTDLGALGGGAGAGAGGAGGSSLGALAPYAAPLAFAALAAGMVYMWASQEGDPMTMLGGATMTNGVLDDSINQGSNAAWLAGYAQDALTANGLGAHNITTNQFRNERTGKIGMYLGVDSVGSSFYLDGVDWSQIQNWAVFAAQTSANMPPPGSVSGGAFVAGGDFAGGIRLVGERGPELELTGPSRIFDANTTAAMLRAANDGGNSASNQALQDELRALREDNRSQALALAQLNARMVRVLERWDGDGLPVRNNEGDLVAVGTSTDLVALYGT